MIPAVRLSIVKALVRARKPLTLSAIARESSVPKQKVAYHLPALIDEGVVLPLDGGLYAAQPVFRDKEALPLLDPLIYHFIHNVDPSSAKSLEETVVNVLGYFFAMQDVNGRASKSL